MPVVVQPEVCTQINKWIVREQIFRVSGPNDISPRDLSTTPHASVFQRIGLWRHVDRIQSLEISEMVLGSIECGDQISVLARTLKGAPLERHSDVDSLMGEIRSIFKGRSVLVLGDDHGTASEVINYLGGSAVGVEMNSKSVSLARLGLYNRDFKPSSQVIEGDIWNILVSGSALQEAIQSRGPYDVILSRFFFSPGSRGEYPRVQSFFRQKNLPLDRSRCREIGIDTAKVPDETYERFSHFFNEWLVRSQFLLKPDGLQAHFNSGYPPLAHGNLAASDRYTRIPVERAQGGGEDFTYLKNVGSIFSMRTVSYVSQHMLFQLRS